MSQMKNVGEDTAAESVMAESTAPQQIVYVSPDGTQQYVVSQDANAENNQCEVDQLSYVIQSVEDEMQQPEEHQGDQGMVQMELVNEDGSTTIVLIPSQMVPDQSAESEPGLMSDTLEASNGEQTSTISAEGGYLSEQEPEPEPQFIIVHPEDGTETVREVPNVATLVNHGDSDSTQSETSQRTVPNFTVEKTEDGDFIVIPMFPSGTGGQDTTAKMELKVELEPPVADEEEKSHEETKFELHLQPDSPEKPSPIGSDDHGYCSEKKSSKSGSESSKVVANDSEHTYSLLDENASPKNKPDTGTSTGGGSRILVPAEIDTSFEADTGNCVKIASVVSKKSHTSSQDVGRVTAPPAQTVTKSKLLKLPEADQQSSTSESLVQGTTVSVVLDSIESGVTYKMSESQAPPQNHSTDKSTAPKKTPGIESGRNLASNPAVIALPESVTLETFDHKCHVCGNAYTRPYDLKNHLENVHNIMNSASSGPAKSKSGGTGNLPGVIITRPSGKRNTVTFNSEEDMYDVKSLRCHLCFLIFSSKQALALHMQLSHQIVLAEVPMEELLAYDLNARLCKLCSMKFTTRYELEVHMQNKHSVHLGKLKEKGSFWKCCHCPLVTSSQKALKQHVQAKHASVGADGRDDSSGMTVVQEEARDKAKNISSRACAADSKNGENSASESPSIDKTSSASIHKQEHESRKEASTVIKPTETVSSAETCTDSSTDHVRKGSAGHTEGSKSQKEQLRSVTSPMKTHMQPCSRGPAAIIESSSVAVVKGGSIINFAGTFDLETLKCKLCDMKFEGSKELSQHMASIHSVAVQLDPAPKLETDIDSDADPFDIELLVCCLCELQFSSMARLKRHMRSSHGIDTERYMLDDEYRKTGSLVSHAQLDRGGREIQRKRRSENVSSGKSAKRMKICDADKPVTGTSNDGAVSRTSVALQNRHMKRLTTSPGRKDLSNEGGEDGDCEIVTRRGPLTCKQCSISFSFSKDLRKHILKEHVINSQLAPGEGTRNDTDQEEGRTVDVNSRTCNLCDRSFSNTHNLKLHMKFKHSISIDLDSSWCGGNSDTGHQSSEVGSDYDVSQSECRICDIRFARSRILKQHMKNIHEIMVCLDTDTPFISPVSSPTKKPTKRAAVISDRKEAKRERIEKDSVNYDVEGRICKLCEKTFAYHYGLKRHMQNQHSIEVIVSAGFQPEKIPEEPTLEQMSQYHDSYDLNGLQCEICCLTFAGAYNLRRHMWNKHQINISKKIQPISVSRDESDNEDGRSEDMLSKDERVGEAVLQDNQYDLEQKRCNICETAYTTQFNVRRHMEDAHGIHIPVKKQHDTILIDNKSKGNLKNITDKQSAELICRDLGQYELEKPGNKKIISKDSHDEGIDDRPESSYDVSKRECNICPKKFGTRRGLEQHMRRQHDIHVGSTVPRNTENQNIHTVQTKNCKEVKHDTQSAEEPMDHHIDEVDDDQSSGSYSLSTQQQEESFEKMSPEDMFDVRERKCHICSMIFARPYNLKRHFENTHSLLIDVREKPLDTVDYSVSQLKCNICEAGFTTIQALRCHMRKIHLQTVHTTSIAEKLPSDEYYASDDGDSDKESGTDDGLDSRRTSRGSLAPTASLEYDVDLRTCYICSSYFARVQSLRTHMKKRHGTIIDVKDFSAVQEGQDNEITHDTCKEAMSDDSSGKPGQKTEPGNVGDDYQESPPKDWFEKYHLEELKCNICDVFFARMVNLKRHMRAAHKMVIYANDIPESVRKLDPSSFNCTECLMHFSTSSGLRRHRINKHHPVTCLVCNEVFENSMMFQEHNMEKHIKRASSTAVGASNISESEGRRVTPAAVSGEVAGATTQGDCEQTQDGEGGPDAEEELCSVCHEQFSSVESLNSHMRNSHSSPAGREPSADALDASGKISDKSQPMHTDQEDSTRSSVPEISKPVFRLLAGGTDNVTLQDDGFTAVTNEAGSEQMTSIEVNSLGEVIHHIENAEESELMEIRPGADVAEALLGSAPVLVPITDVEGQLISIPESATVVSDREGSVDVVLEDDFAALLSDDMGIDLSDAIASLSGNQLSCPICAVKFTKLSTLRAHLKMHTMAPQFQCAVCQAEFHNTLDLGKHMRKHNIAKGFKCALCGNAFKTAAGLRVHNFIHTGEKPHKCTIEDCTAAFTSSNKLKRHVEQTHRMAARPFQCQLCPKSYRYQNELDVHMRRHTGEKPYKCSECDKAFSLRGSLNVHRARDHSQDQPFQCGVCGKHFARGPDINKHMKIKHCSVPQQKCEVCDKEFRTRTALTAHRITHAQNPQMPYECTVCQRGFVRKPDLQRHQLVHADRYSYLCSICPRAFRDRGALKNHIRKHTGEKPFKCRVAEDCDKCFTTTSGRHLHERTHSDAKPYQCKFCPKAYKDPSHLRRHHLVHTGANRPCPVCGRKFSDSSSLQRHMRVHTGERPYVCSVCDQTFKDAGHLRVHRRKHTGERPYICDYPIGEVIPGQSQEICGKAFTSNTHMKYHRLSHQDKQVKCSKCQKCFRRLNQLKNHMKSHKDDHLAYKCTLCGKQCRKLGYLKNHLRTHTTDQYTCNGCDKVFKSKKGLLKHNITYNCGDINIPVAETPLKAEPTEEQQAASEIITEAMDVAVDEAVTAQEILVEDVVVESVDDIYFVQTG